ncbi:hypothetical protein IWT140_01927 [Secundilactobacillus pentosiphilus]|uniref:Uncharacterized protein n=1 Tax=Secundilactobacillus pentosiphilus TaxID=1714682 RepID=A0A1Z5IRC1_9LACO|nr:hypothetical protein [Secundilactobacillus pentosiphilus]GAX04289.1 hypothetical protein IWT140_01927 [Secundilactobacillus pentosiphilus]
MKFRHVILAIVATFGIATAATFSNTATAHAANPNAAYYHLYKTIPSVLHGTWRQKGWNRGSKPKTQYTYTIRKNSYTMYVNYQGSKKKTKKMTFPRKYFAYIDYRYSSKEYEISPSGPMKYLGYLAILYLKPTHHNGQKALRCTFGGGDTIYLYWVHK